MYHFEVEHETGKLEHETGKLRSLDELEMSKMAIETLVFEIY